MRKALFHEEFIVKEEAAHDYYNKGNPGPRTRSLTLTETPR